MKFSEVQLKIVKEVYNRRTTDMEQANARIVKYIGLSMLLVSDTML